MSTPLLIKANIPQPLINQTNNTCYNDVSFTQLEYLNPGLDRWASVNYIMDYMGLQQNIDLGANTLKNNCQNINIHSLKTLPPRQNIGQGYIKLSDDNIKLMSGCEFTSNIKPITKKPCLEAMQNIEDQTIQMSYFEKGYLIAFTLLTVGLLYKATNRIKY